MFPGTESWARASQGQEIYCAERCHPPRAESVQRSTNECWFAGTCFPGAAMELGLGRAWQRGTSGQPWQKLSTASAERKYRKSAQMISQEIETNGCVLENLKALDDCAGRLHELYLEVQQSAAVRPVVMPPDYLPALARLAGEDFACIVLRKGEQILGF